MIYTDWLRTWLENYIRPSVKVRTYERYKLIIEKHLKDTIGGMELNDLSPLVLQSFITELLRSGNIKTGKGLSANSVNAVISVIHPHCHEMNFTDMDDTALLCVDCKKKIAVPYKLSVNNFEIAAEKDKHLTEYHLIYGDRQKIIGTIVESKKTADVFGLRNDSSEIWIVHYPGKEEMYYETGKTVTLIRGTEIKIATKTVKII